MFTFRSMMPIRNRVVRLFFLILCLGALSVGLLAQSTQAFGQSTLKPPVYVQAKGSANVRSGPGIDYDFMGTITVGATYRVVGRAARFPWLLIDVNGQLCWVYTDLVSVNGDLNGVPYDSTVIKNPSIITSGTATPVFTQNSPQDPVYVVVTNTLAPFVTLTPPANLAVSIQAVTTANVRYAPDINAPIVGRIASGQSYAVSRRHARVPWLEIVSSIFPGGRGWVNQQTVVVTGDLNTVPLTDNTSEGYPTLTPTPNIVITVVPPNATPVVGVNSVLTDLSNDINAYLMGQGYVPRSAKQASVFIMNLATGHAFVVNPEIAYSGASTAKIFSLLALYRKLNAAPDGNQAYLIASMIVCSENSTSNTILQILGDGDLLKGAQYVNETIALLGLKDSFLNRAFLIGTAPTPAPANVPPAFTTQADQLSAKPDPLNQTTSADLGITLAAIYQCALNGTGSIMDAYQGAVSVDECRQMVNVMAQERGKNLISGGVPEGGEFKIAHKTGFVDDTHSDAGIILTPGGDYVLVVMMHAEPQLSFNASFPIIGEISRRVYNAFNPARPLSAARTDSIPQCQLSESLRTTLQSEVGPFMR